MEKKAEAEVESTVGLPVVLVLVVVQLAAVQVVLVDDMVVVCRVGRRERELIVDSVGVVQVAATGSIDCSCVAV